MNPKSSEKQVKYLDSRLFHVVKRIFWFPCCIARFPRFSASFIWFAAFQPSVCPSPHHPHLSAAKGPTISSVFHHPLTGLQTCQELWLGQVVTSIEPSTITVLPKDDGVPYELSLPKWSMLEIREFWSNFKEIKVRIKPDFPQQKLHPVPTCQFFVDHFPTRFASGHGRGTNGLVQAGDHLFV